MAAARPKPEVELSFGQDLSVGSLFGCKDKVVVITGKFCTAVLARPLQLGLRRPFKAGEPCSPVTPSW
jgi:hypothetical protein